MHTSFTISVHIHQFIFPGANTYRLGRLDGQRAVPRFYAFNELRFARIIGLIDHINARLI